ncbi:MAG TPA: MaoC family dehydratase [Bauldia sp.]|nr:MaoC family dehydratase [Bauldia sp.]
MIYEEVIVGSEHPFGTHRFTAEEVRRFALAYDPQPFHLDEEAAKASPFGAICASGWHTASVMMGLLVRYMARTGEHARTEGRRAAHLGPSPGFDDLKWLRAVYPGDTVTFTGRIVAKRESASRPGWGLVTMETTGVNQKGERVFVVTGHIFVARANPAS